MRLSLRFILLMLLITLSAALSAQSVTIGDDLFVGAEGAEQTPQATRDLFSAGPDIELREAVGADAHVAGFSVLVDAPIGSDLYVAGGSVRINAAVGDDLTAMGFSVATGPDATIGGNARLSGGSLRIEGPVAGTLAVSGGSVFLDARIGGDAWLSGRDIEFGPNAEVVGELHVASPNETSIPDTVTAPDQIIFEWLDDHEMPMHPPEWAPDWTNGWMRNMGRGWDAPHPLYLLGGTVVTLTFLFIIGAAALTLAPERTEALRSSISEYPWASLFWGIIGLSALLGLIPLSVVTLIGLPLVPFVVLSLILLWTIGYLAGVYSIAMALLSGSGRSAQTSGIGKNLFALAVGLLVASVLNFVPFLGWVVNLVIGFLGVGAIVQTLIGWKQPSALPAQAGTE